MKLELLKQDIDCDQIVTGKDLDIETYKKKLEMWEYVKKNDLMKSEDKLTRARATLLLKDPTLYFLSFFKNENGEPFELFAFQDAIANCVMEYKTGVSDPMDPNRYVLFRGSNQIGKTGLEKLLVIKRFFGERNKNILLVTNRKELTSFILSDIKLLIDNSKFGKDWKLSYDQVSDNQTILSVVGKDKKGNLFTNRVIVSTAGEGALGYPVHYMFLDECDFYEDGRRLFWRIFNPRLKFTKGQIVAFSNPNPEINRKRSLLWDLWGGDAKNFFRRKFSFYFLDNPRNAEEEFEYDKRNTPSDIFQSTHLGQFPDEGGSFFSNSQISDMLQKHWTNKLPAVDRPVYISLDLGKMRDNTILSLGIAKDPKDPRDKFKDLDCLYQKEYPLRTSYADIADDLIKIQDHYKKNYYGVADTGYDATGDKTFYDLVRSKGASIRMVDFNRKESNKTLLYRDFQLMAENRKIKVVWSDKCEKQLAGMEIKETESKKLKKVENKSDSVHDDYVDSLAILIHIAVKPSRVPVSAVIVNKKTKDDAPETEDQRDESVKAYYAKILGVGKPRRYGNMYQ